MNILSLLNSRKDKLKNLRFNNKFIFINRECSLKHWNSYFDKKNNIEIKILGRPVIDRSEWKHFSKFEKCYISKILINKFLKLNFIDFCNELNGAFSILIIDYNLNRLIIITDKLGIYPIYAYKIDNLKKFQFSSNFNHLINNIDNQLKIDLVSVAEFMKKGFIYHPNTYCKEIQTLDNGSYTILDFKKNKITKKLYFKITPKPIYNFKYLVNELSKALLNSIDRRTSKYFGKKAIFLSGGTDSRMILENSLKMNTQAVTLFNDVNDEIVLAKKIAKLCKVKHHLIRRQDDYYLKSYYNSIDTNGGRCLPSDDHFLNLKDNEIINEFDTILTGCYADWLFKGIALDRKQLTFFNIRLPLYKLASFKYDFFSKRTKLNQTFEKLIKEREERIFINKNSHISNEIARLFPLFQEETAATRLTLQQLFPWDSVFSDNDVIKVYEQIPVEYKINSEIYHKAVSKILKNTKNVPHAGHKHKIGINKYYGTIIYLSKIILIKILQLIKIKKNNPITGDKSWMSSKEYAKSDFIFERWKVAQSFKLFKKMLNIYEPKFEQILKNDHKLIFKCIVLHKVITQKLSRLNLIKIFNFK